jgi:hypothetical protein
MTGILASVVDLGTQEFVIMMTSGITWSVVANKIGAAAQQDTAGIITLVHAYDVGKIADLANIMTIIMVHAYDVLRFVVEELTMTTIVVDVSATMFPEDVLGENTGVRLLAPA